MKTILQVSFLFLLTSLAWAQKKGLETVIQKGHNAAVKAVTVSPNGQYIVTGSRDKSAKLWNATTGLELRSYIGHTHTINSVQLSPDFMYLATSSADNTAKLWDIRTGKELFSTPVENKYMTDVAFSPDSKLFVSAGYHDKAKIWEIKSLQLVKEIETNADQGSGYGVNLAFSPDGKWLAIGEDNKTVKVYETKDWQLTYTLTPEKGWCGGCGTLVNFSHDSKYLLKVSHNSPVEKYDMLTGKLVQSYGGEFDDITGVAFDSSDAVILGGSSKYVMLWNSTTGAVLDSLVFDKEQEEITEVVFGTNAKELYISKSNNMALKYSVPKKEIIHTYTGILNDTDKGGVNYDPDNYWDSYIAKYIRLKNKVLISPDGKTLLKGKLGTKAKRWDIATGQTVKEYLGHEKAVISFTYTDDGQYLITGDGAGKMIYWDAVSGKAIRKFDAHREPLFEVKINPSGTEVATASWDASVTIWDITSGKQVADIDMKGNSAYALSYTPDGLYLVTGRFDKTLELWEPDSKTVVRSFIGHSDVVSTIVFGNDTKQMLTSSWDGTARIWDITTGMMVKKFKGHTGALHTAIYSLDNKSILTAGDDRAIRVWDIASGKVIKSLEGHQAEVTSLNLSKDGKTLISASLDGVIKIWNLEKGQEFYEHIHVGNNDWMAKTKEGYFNATDGARSAIHFVKGLESYSADQFFEEFYRPDLLPSLYKNRGETGSLPNIDSKLTSSPPPTIKISSVATENKNEVELYVKIIDNGGGVGELRISQNGKQIPLNEKDLSFPSQSGQSTVYKQRVALIGGHNVFSATGISKGRMESSPAELKVISTNSEKSSTCYILSIGIDEYKNNKLTLNYAKEDAESFSKAVEEHSGKLFSKVEVHSLYDKEASRQNILQQLDELIAKIQVHDVFIFYYAGHGSMVDNRFFFIPSECTRLFDINSLTSEALEATVMQQKMKHIKALKQIVIMDACQSGGSVELLAMRGAGEEKAIAQLSRSAGIHVLASAGGEQNAKELATLGHGLFTYVLINALNGKADGSPKDGKVTVYELKSYLDDQVPELNQQNNGKPQYPYTFSRGHDFPIVME
ncbi:MAG: repeat-containing protein [Cytophagaceae bacterium]|jgi:WD40 repeat protein|nr:repeat-containing protein [Cytophagaceae bacterium]